jgi:1,4-dihydroxy-2-naphthoate polyprenyltransferase
MNDIKTWLGPMRPPFLVLGPVCVFLGLAVAIWQHAPVSVLHVILALVGAVCAHIAVNAFNEYFDFKSGLDLRTRRTPFSGGSGTLPAHPEALKATLITGIVTFAITALIGLYFCFKWSWWLLPLGLLGLVVVYIYTNWLTRMPFLCLLAPGLGFGTLMVLGTFFALTGRYNWAAFAASMTPFFLVSNLLLLNQFPDVEADQTIGRLHYPILAGRKTSAWIYVAFLAGTYLSIILGVATGVMPRFALLGLLSLAIAVPTGLNVLKNAENIPALAPSMGMNVILNLVTPLLLGIGFLIG